VSVVPFEKKPQPDKGVMFEVTEDGTLKSNHKVLLCTYTGPEALSFLTEQGRLVFHLTNEGITVDLLDEDYNVCASLSHTAQEFVEEFFEDQLNLTE
jgi:hypothetical protein